MTTALSISQQDNVLYLSIWTSRAHYCQNPDCKKHLGDKALKWMFHHLLEKRKKKHAYHDFRQYRHCQWNIWLLCRYCHDAYERNPDTCPLIHAYRAELIILIAQPNFRYDSDEYWLDNTDTPVETQSIIQTLFPQQNLKYD